MKNNDRKLTRREKIVVALVALLILAVLAPYALAVFGLITQGSWPAWSGFGDYVSPTVAEGQDFQRGKTLWDLTELLIIPVVLALGAIWFNRQERKTEREIATRREKTERDLAEDRIRENALQAYLDRMTELLLEKDLRKSDPEDEVRSVARSRTLTVLRGLDPVRKGEVVRFLYESRLISREGPIIDLSEADLSKVNLRGANLTKAYLNRVRLCQADLSNANLSETKMIGAYLEQVDLSLADLSRADIRRTYLNGVNLSSASLYEANLQGAWMLEADLSSTNLRGAKLSVSDLRKCRNWTQRGPWRAQNFRRATNQTS